MGKGDKRTKRGKTIRGTYGKSRKQAVKKAAVKKAAKQEAA
jgi:ribosomal small subunit protein bTHX